MSLLILFRRWIGALPMVQATPAHLAARVGRATGLSASMTGVTHCAGSAERATRIVAGVRHV